MAKSASDVYSGKGGDMSSRLSNANAGRRAKILKRISEPYAKMKVSDYLGNPLDVKKEIENLEGSDLLKLFEFTIDIEVV